jgi:hypothetical protein
VMLPSWLFALLLGFSLCIAVNLTCSCCRERQLRHGAPPRLIEGLEHDLDQRRAFEVIDNVWNAPTLHWVLPREIVTTFLEGQNCILGDIG